MYLNELSKTESETSYPNVVSLTPVELYAFIKLVRSGIDVFYEDGQRDSHESLPPIRVMTAPAGGAAFVFDHQPGSPHDESIELSLLAGLRLVQSVQATMRTPAEDVPF